jgi:hypothetical protein
MAHTPAPAWPGWSDAGTLVMPLAAPPPVRPLTLDGLRLQPKRELHVTLIGGRLAERLRASLRDPYLTAAVRTLYEAHDWHFATSGEYRLLRKPARRDDGRFGATHSVIALLTMPAMAAFHHGLGRLLGTQLPLPPPHVTLYVEGRAQGIGVRSPSALRGYAVRAIAPHELDAGAPA